MEGDIIKARVSIARQFFPKNNAKIETGDFGILSVVVEEVFEGNPEIDGKWGTITIKGTMIEWEYGEQYNLIAKQLETTNFGTQYEILSIFREVNLDTIENQKKFLKHILTEKQIEEIYKTISNPIEVLKNGDIDTLCSVKGIGTTTAIRILDKYEETKDYSSAFLELDKLGLTDTMVKKLCDSYGNPDTLIQKIKDNPYIIADEVNGVGWSKADEITLNSGYKEDSINRVKAYIKFYLKNQANNLGNSWCYTEDLIDAIEDNLNKTTDETISKALKELLEKRIIWSDKGREKIALFKNLILELLVAYDLIRLNNGNNDFKYDNYEEIIKQQEEKQGWNFTEEQKKAVVDCLKHNVLLIQGLGGVGKTSIVAIVLNILQSYEFSQCALSGKASVNLSEKTGQEGYTIHRLLGYNPHEGYLYNRQIPLPNDGVVLDELSMVDIPLFYKLIQSIKTNNKLIMMGDIGQLQNIGLGNLMIDIIESEVIPVSYLTEIHRQAKKSAIITNSIDVWHGKQIIDKDFEGVEIRGELQDLVLDIKKDSKDTAKRIMKYFKELYNKIDNIMDLQVIVPVKKRGDTCTLKLNNEIQSYIRKQKGLSDDEKHIQIGKDYKIYEGDKVINTKNNYKTYNCLGVPTPIMNGNMGIVKEILDNMLIIDFERIGEVIIPSEQIKSIELGYCVTVHKYQGSQVKYVICGLDNSHYTMRTKELLYTMITRAKEYCVLCGENKAIRYAVSHSGSRNRQTFLSFFLQYIKEKGSKELLNYIGLDLDYIDNIINKAKQQELLLENMN